MYSPAKQTLKEKETWNEWFERYIRDLDAKKPVVWGGDLNVAPTELGQCPHLQQSNPIELIPFRF